MSRETDFLCNHHKRRLLPISKTESIAVASKDKEPEDIAAYTESIRFNLEKNKSDDEFDLHWRTHRAKFDQRLA